MGTHLSARPPREFVIKLAPQAPIRHITVLLGAVYFSERRDSRVYLLVLFYDSTDYSICTAIPYRSKSNFEFIFLGM